MEEKDCQKLFMTEIDDVDSVIQLKSGKLLFYNFRGDYTFSIYNQKTFKKILYIDLYILIFKKIFQDYIEQNNINNNEEINYDEVYNKCLTENQNNKNSIKEVDNGIILIGRNKSLIEIKINGENFEIKELKRLNDIILEINELYGNRLIIIIKNDIIVLRKVNNEYIIKEEYKIKENWKIAPFHLTEISINNFNQYFYCYELPNDKLLLNSFSIELSFSDCGTHPPGEFSNSKIIFIETKSFKEIRAIESFSGYAKTMILENIIIIQALNNIALYNKNDLNFIKSIEIKGIHHYLNHIYNYDNEYTIILSDIFKRMNLLIFKIENNDIKQSLSIYPKIYFKLNRERGYEIRGISNKQLFTLRDKRIIIFCNKKIYVLNLPFN